MISNSALQKFLASIPAMRILIVGDIILDHYLYGQVNRISPEAPVPILLSEREEYRLGGAGNVFLNLTALGAQVSLTGVTGDDQAGRTIREISPARYLGLMEPGRVTPVKTRLIANRQQILRIDHETAEPISSASGHELRQIISTCPADAYLLSDYAKGCLNAELAQHVIRLARDRQVPVIADPKPANIHFFRQASTITPNRSEAESVLGMVIDNDAIAARAASLLMKKLQTDSAIITRGAQGVTIRQRSHQPFHLPSFSHEVYDVTGAGDTFAALLILGMVAGLPIRQTLWLANAAASIVIERIGAATLSPDELFERCQRLKKRAHSAAAASVPV